MEPAGWCLPEIPALRSPRQEDLELGCIVRGLAYWWFITQQQTTDIQELKVGSGLGQDIPGPPDPQTSHPWEGAPAGESQVGWAAGPAYLVILHPASTGRWFRATLQTADP
jgi:hypothetical protein